MNGKAGHKSFDEIKSDISILHANRNCDNISIAGGETAVASRNCRDCGLYPQPQNEADDSDQRGGVDRQSSP